jgi:hypothetical protein
MDRRSGREARCPSPSGEVFGIATEAGDRACRGTGPRLTVARQRRTLTGFAFDPSHPGVQGTSAAVLNCVWIIHQAAADKAPHLRSM